MRGIVDTVLSIGAIPLQFIFESVPWWFPIAIVAAGLLLYGIPYVDAFVGARIEEWQYIPLIPRIAVVGLLVSGAGLVVFTQLGQFDWMYVLFLFTYTRAIEGATMIHFFGRIDEVTRAVFGDGGGGSWSSKIRMAVSWLVRRFLRRLPLLIVTSVLIALAVVLLVSVLFGFPGTRITVRLAAVATVTTFALSTVNTAWVLRKVTDELGIWAFLGVVFCVVGGELYNVPAAFSLFSSMPALEGPFSAWTTVTVGLIGWFLGLMLALIFFAHRVRHTDAEVIHTPG